MDIKKDELNLVKGGAVVLSMAVMKSPVSTVIEHFHLDCLLPSNWDGDSRILAVTYIVMYLSFCQKVIVSVSFL